MGKVPEVDVNEHDEVVIRQAPQVRGAPALPGYEVRLLGPAAAALAHDLVTEHRGARLYEAKGAGRGPDGTRVTVRECGCAWVLGFAQLIVTTGPRWTADTGNRLTLDELDLEDRWRLAARLAENAARVDDQ